MSAAALGTVGAILRLRVRLAANALRAAAEAGSPARRGRTGTARKAAENPLAAVILMAVLSSAACVQVVYFLAYPPISRGPEVVDLSRTAPYLLHVSYTTALAVLGVVLVTIAYRSRDLARLDADVEWLLTLPVPTPAIFAAKVVENTVLSLGWFVYVPFYAAVAWFWGYRFSAVPIALATALLLNVLVAVALFAFELAAQRLLSPQALQRVQALCAIPASIVALFGHLTPMLLKDTKDAPGYRVFVEAVGAATLHLPTGLVLQALAPQGPGNGAVKLALFAGQAVLGMAAGFAVVRWCAARGLEAVASVRQGSRGARARAGLGHGIVGKELHFLARDHRLQAEAFSPLLPLVLFPAVPGPFGTTFRTIVDNGVLPLGVGLMLLMATATGAVVHEGPALWLLFTAPRRLADLLLKKAAFWASMAVAAGLALCVSPVLYRPLRWSDAVTAGWVVATLPLYAVLCAGFGVVGADPLSPERRRRASDETVLTVFLIGFLVLGAPQLPGRFAPLAALVLFALLSWAVWERAVRSVDLLLDPVARPAPRVELADGMAVAFVFVLVQALTTGVLSGLWRLGPATAALVGFVLASGAGAWYAVGRLRTEGIPLAEAFPLFTSGVEALRRATPATALGAAAALAAGAALAMVPRRPPRASADALPAWEQAMAMVIGPVVGLALKPVLDELVFRGLVYRPLRRTLAPLPAAALAGLVSALPAGPLGLAPAFVAGTAAGLVVEKTGALFPAMLVNLAFAGGALAVQWVLAR